MQSKSKIPFKNLRHGLAAHYSNGHYYAMAHFTFKNGYTGDSICFQNARVIAHDYQPIDLYVKSQIGKLTPHRIRWDFNRQKYYTDLLAVSFNKTLKVEDETGTIYEFIPNQYGIQMQQSANKEILENWKHYRAKYKEWEAQRVDYLPEQKILYIYTRMIYGQEDYNLIDSIKKAGMGKSIDKIVLTLTAIRCNLQGKYIFFKTKTPTLPVTLSRR